MYAVAYCRPVQSAKAAAECGDGDGANVACPDFFDKRLQTGLYVRHAAFVSPVPFGRKVDDVAGRGEFVCLKDKYAPRAHCTVLTTGGIGRKVFGKGALELERDASPHDADTVDGVDQGLDFFREDVPGFVFDHNGISTVTNNTTRV